MLGWWRDLNPHLSLYFRWLSQWPQADYVGWNKRRSRWDLNPQPSDRQSDALANCATTPKKGGLLLTTAWYRQTSVTAPIHGSSIGKLAYLFLVRDDMLPPLLIYSRQWLNRVYTHSTCANPTSLHPCGFVGVIGFTFRLWRPVLRMCCPTPDSHRYFPMCRDYRVTITNSITIWS